MNFVLKVVRTFFLRGIKFLPAFLGGPLLWGWIYGAPRLPTWAVLGKNFPFSLNPPEREKFRRLTPQFSLHPRGVFQVYPLEDEEWFSLDTVFPVEGVEPFQELGLDYFMQQQDDNLETQQDSPTEEDYMYGTSSGEYTDEDNPGISDIDLFYKLETREQTYFRDDHPGPDEVEIFTPLQRRRRAGSFSFKKWGLGRITTPGEGPTSFNREDNPLGYDGYYPQWTGWADWHLWRVSPTRITADFNWPETFYYYMLFENRHTWAGDPTNDDPTQWARNARGWPVWLFRRHSRLWGPGRWRVHKEWVKRRRYNWWSKPWIKTYKKWPNGFHRRYKRFRYWYRLRELEMNPRSNRWGAPFSGRTPNPMLEPDDWGYFPNTRFLESSFFYRRKRLSQRYQKLNQGVRRRWRPRRGWRPRFGWARRKGFFNPRWWSTLRVGRTRPVRARIAPWVAPRWAPVGKRIPSELPPTGVVPGLLLVGGWFLCWFVWENRYAPWAFLYFPFFFDNTVSEGGPAPYPPDEFSSTRGWAWWQTYSVSGSFGGDYLRKGSLGLPNEWELIRGGTPRERVSTRTFGDGAYSLTWGGKWHYLSPVGRRWWSHPDIGGNILGLTFRDATFDTYYLFDILIADGLWYSQNMFGWNGADVANLLERQIYFPYIDYHIPSWAHAHDVIGDSWVVYRGFRTWVDGGQELTTVRRMIDHRYNRIFDITQWLYKIFYKRFWPAFDHFITFRGDVLPQYEEIQQLFFLLPTWVPPSPVSGEGTSQWEIAYLEGWEKVTSTQLWPSPRALRRQSMGLDVLDQTNSLDSRPRSRSEGFVYLGVPTSWEAQLNFKLLQKWSISPWLVDPQVPLIWFDSRVSLFLSRVGPWCTYLFWSFLIPVGALSFYGAAFFSWRITPQGGIPTGVQVIPQERYTPPSGGGVHIFSSISSPAGGAHGVATLREGRHLRRRPRFPAQGDPARAWRAPSTWRWSPEEYWAHHRLGFSRQSPRMGRQKRNRTFFSSCGTSLKLKGVNSSFRRKEKLLSPGGGLGYSLTRFSSRAQKEKMFRPLPERNKKEGTAFSPLFSVGKNSLHGGWLWRGWFPPSTTEATPPQEKAYPFRGRRRRPRGDDRLLTPHGTWSPHRRSDPPRGDYSSEVYTPHGVTPVEGFFPTPRSRVFTFWKLPPEWFTRSLHSQWIVNRYRCSLSGGAQSGNFSFSAPAGLTLKGFTQLGELNFPGALFVHHRGKVLSPGYNTEFYSDEYFDLVEDGHQVDDGYEEHNFDTLGEDYLGFRYLGGWTPPGVGLSPTLGERLLSYHRGQILPVRAYKSFPSGGGGNPTWGGPLWGSLGVDHPAAAYPLLGGYEIPRLYRRVYRQEEEERTTLLERGGLRNRKQPRSFKKVNFSFPKVRRKKRKLLKKGRRFGWSTPFSLLTSAAALQDQLYRLGWSTAEGNLTFCLDDQDSLEFGFSSLHGGGYTRGGPAGLSYLQERPYHRKAQIWSPPRGLNTWRYLVGEDLTQLNRSEGETVFFERLTTAYTDNYEEDAEGELGIVFDRDPEDEYFDAQNFEELDAEIPRPRVIDFPVWLLEEALGGASPGVIQPEGVYSRFGEANFAVPDGGQPGWRSSRRELRRHYRRARIKVSRWRRQQNPIRFPRGADLVNQHLRDVSPGGPDEQSLTPDEMETFTGIISDDLEAEEEEELELRLWALTEIYYGDYPTGTFLDS